MPDFNNLQKLGLTLQLTDANTQQNALKQIQYNDALNQETALKKDKQTAELNKAKLARLDQIEQMAVNAVKNRPNDTNVRQVAEQTLQGVQRERASLQGFDFSGLTKVDSAPGASKRLDGNAGLMSAALSQPKKAEVGNIKPENYTLESIENFNQTGNFTDLKRVDKSRGISDISPNQFTGASIDKFRETGSFSDLEKTSQSQTTSEFERLLNSSNLNEEGRQKLRTQRLNKLISGDGVSFESDGKGGVSFSSGGNKNKSVKERKEVKDLRVKTRRFLSQSNKVLASVKNNSKQLGVVGALARVGGEIKSTVQNFANANGIDMSEVSRDINSYDYGDLAAESAGFKTQLFSVALLFASASGLGEGRALTDKDVQRAIDNIGGSTNDPNQLISRIQSVQETLVDNVRILSEESDLEFKDLPEFKKIRENETQEKNLDQELSSKGFSFSHTNNSGERVYLKQGGDPNNINDFVVAGE
ncbi:MAG: hypothetical protein DHS20C13_27960 [Thermodesulfobacteriota bacterium]|nr:MAG: hypothetical protein DHS20C13_27960 [Thermodesulfobacteriota bacterium]